MKRFVALGAACLSACAPIASLAPTHVDVPITTRTVERAQAEGLVGEASQDGTTLHVSASQACDILDEHTVSRTTEVRHENHAKWLDATIGVVAVAAVGGGTWLMLDSSKVHDDDTTSRTYNPTGPSKAFAYGVATTAGGVALLSIPIIDIVRAHAVDEKTAKVTLDGDIQQRSAKCSNRPLVDGSVSLKVAGALIEMGVTNAQGRLDVDVLAAIHADMAPAVLRGNVPIFVRREQIGMFDLTPVYDAREDRAWQIVSVDSCKSPSTPESCDSVVAFARKWSQGPHAAEATGLLSGARAEMERLREERLWAATDLKPCASGAEEPPDIEEACNSLERNYIAAFPTGPRADEARAAVEKGRARAAAIRDRLTKEAEREAAQEQRREQRAAVKECRSRCQMGCSSWRIRDEGMCLVGCLQQCGDE